MKILLLGVGLQGKAALYDLVNSPDVDHVIAADSDVGNLKAYVSELNSDKVSTVNFNASDHSEIFRLMTEVQAVICLLPAENQFQIARLAVEKGIHFIETNFASPEFTKLGRIAAAKDVALLPEFGLDPGIDLVLIGRAIRELDEVNGLQTYGTGIPEIEAADNPLKYKISWTFSGVLNAYQRPAFILKDRQIIELSPAEKFDQANVKLVDIEDLGTVEAYPDGDAVKYLENFGISESTQNSGRYSLRWLGHAAFWAKMVSLGFLSDKPVQVGDTEISPRQFIHDFLSPQLQYDSNERDIAAIGVDVTGLRGGERKRIIYQMIDRRDLKTGFLAMQRTVGFTASIGAQMLLRGDIKKRGLLMPGNDVPSDLFIHELEKRGIYIKRFEMDW